MDNNEERLKRSPFFVKHCDIVSSVYEKSDGNLCQDQGRNLYLFFSESSVPKG